MGNRNGGGNSGAMRVTMDSRVVLANNLCAFNDGGLYLQRSCVRVFRNTILDPILFKDYKDELAGTEFLNNVIGDRFTVPGEVTVKGNLLAEGASQSGATNGGPIFVNDEIAGRAERVMYDGERLVTTILVGDAEFPPQGLTARILRFGDYLRVIRTNNRKSLEFWGPIPTELADAEAPEFLVLPTYRLNTEAQSAGHDFAGIRPLPFWRMPGLSR